MVVMDNELFNYYSLSECTDRDSIFKALDKLRDNDKIIYSWDEQNDTVILEDLELSDSEIKKLLKFFDKEDIISNFDYIDDGYHKNDDYSDFDEDYDF